MKKAFTLIELMVAIGILAMVLSFASLIFRSSTDSYRTASANAEIMRKLRAITDQLNADFKGLRKDGEIFIIWVPVAAGPSDPNYDHDRYVRFDRIMFFADGDFQSYGTNPKIVRGNIARICYMLANRSPIAPGDPRVRPTAQNPQNRILARTQHILTADPCFPDIFDPNGFTDNDWYEWNNWLEYDKTTLDEWENISPLNKQNILTVISDVDVNLVSSNTIPSTWKCRGTTVDPVDPNLIHMLLCEGVGEFKVQGWYDIQKRWVPEVDPNGDGDLKDTDFYINPADPTKLDEKKVPGFLYSSPPYNEEDFNLIPGLGRALKFTFTLYDSKGVIKGGRTFTHIVYLDN